MAAAFNGLSWWLKSGKHKNPRTSHASSLSSSPDSSLWDLDSVKFPIAKGGNIGSSSSRKLRRKWHSREEKKVDKEYDAVIVPSDGGCISGSESDDSDWSVGWLEAHGPGFPSDDDDPDNSFAVLVPCYGRGKQDLMDNSRKTGLNTIGNLPPESKKFMEQWLASLQNS